MQHKTLSILLLLSFWTIIESRAEVKILSPMAKISLLTCGPGEAIYSKFGHSALWVFDPTQRIDRVYNYGTFDFYSNDFYLEFIRGTAKYILSVTNFQKFYEEYELENRSIVGQELNLAVKERQDLYERLEDNYKPENRYYLYDFLFQNCSSLIRDIVWEATSGRFAIPEKSDSLHTYRSMMVPYLSATPWLMNGEFVLLGPRTDKEASPWDQMYLPDYMFNWFEAAADTSGSSLVGNTRMLFISRPENEKDKFFTHPDFLLALFLVIVLWFTYREIRLKKKFRIMDSIIFFFTGVLGLLMIYMWTTSKHMVTHENFNLAWAFPLNLGLAILVWFKRSAGFLKYYAMITAPLSILFLCFFWLIPQSFTPAIVLFSTITAVRLSRWAFLPAPL